MNTMDFTTFCLIKEAIQSPHIVDLYILMSMPEPADEGFRFIKNEVINRSNRAILEEIDNVLLREMRHMSTDMIESYMEWSEILKDKYADKADRKHAIKELQYFEREFGASPDKFYKIVGFLSDLYGDEGDTSYLEAETNLEAINKRFKSHVNHQNIVNAFMDYDFWDSGYGGKSWAKIAEMANILNQSVSNPSDFLKKLDRFVDFVHNNGAVINKFHGYHEGWLQYILDLKQHAVNLRELIPYASMDIRKMFRDSNWQELMRKIPGQGAASSFETYKTLIQRYMKDYTKFGHQQNIINIGNMISKIGYDEVVKILKYDIPYKELASVYEDVWDEENLYVDDEDYTNPEYVSELLRKGANAIVAAYKTHPESKY